MSRKNGNNGYIAPLLMELELGLKLGLGRVGVGARAVLGVGFGDVLGQNSGWSWNWGLEDLGLKRLVIGVRVGKCWGWEGLWRVEGWSWGESGLELGSGRVRVE